MQSIDEIIQKDKRHLKFVEWYKEVKASRGFHELEIKKEWVSILREWRSVGFTFRSLFIEFHELEAFEQFYLQHRGETQC